MATALIQMYLETETIDAVLTTEHAASSYGQPVVVVNGDAFGPGDQILTHRGGEVMRDIVRRRTPTDVRDCPRDADGRAYLGGPYNEEPAAHQADADALQAAFCR